MYVSVDDAGRINGTNPNDMSGNTGWYSISNTIGDNITEEHGVPIYKYSNGKAVKRTKAEIAADIPDDTPQPTEADKLEAQVLYTALMTDTLLEDEEG